MNTRVNSRNSPNILRSEREITRQLFEHADTAIAIHQIVVDSSDKPIDYVFLDANPAFEKQTGLKIAGILGRRVRDILPDSDAVPFIDIYGRVAQENQAYTFEQFSSTLGRHYQINAIPLGNGRFATIFSDISKHKTIESSLRESEANFRTFFETIDDMVIVATPEGLIRFNNPAIIRKLGHSADDLLGMHFLDLYPSDKKKEAETNFSALFRGEQEVSSVPLARKDGAFLPVETRLRFGHWGGDNCIFIICKDISAEEEGKQRFERIFRNNPAPMALTEPNQRLFIDVNDAFLKVLGYSKREVIGKTTSDIDFFVHPKQRDQLAITLAQEGRVNNQEIQVHRKDGAVLEGIFSSEIIPIQGQLPEQTHECHCR